MKSFVYDSRGNLKTTSFDGYWDSPNLIISFMGCTFTACLNVAYTIYEYYSEKFSLGEQRKFEETAIKKNDFTEFNSSLFNREEYSVLVNDEKQLLITDSSFTVPLDYFLKRGDEGIEYKISYKNNEFKTGEAWFNHEKISGTSPKFKQLLAANQKAQKQREIIKEREDKKRLAAEERERRKSEISEAQRKIEMEQRKSAVREVCTSMMGELAQYSNLIYDKYSYCHASCSVSCRKGYEGSQIINCVNNCKTCWGILKYENNDCSRDGFNPKDFNILRSSGF